MKQRSWRFLNVIFWLLFAFYGALIKNETILLFCIVGILVMIFLKLDSREEP